MDITFLTNYFIPVIIGICLCAGAVMKHWVKNADNKYIPTISTALGLILAIFMNWSNITADIILSGLVSGLAATGLHQNFAQLIFKEDNK